MVETARAQGATQQRFSQALVRVRLIHSSFSFFIFSVRLSYAGHTKLHFFPFLVSLPQRLCSTQSLHIRFRLRRLSIAIVSSSKQAIVRVRALCVVYVYDSISPRALSSLPIPSPHSHHSTPAPPLDSNPTSILVVRFVVVDSVLLVPTSPKRTRQRRDPIVLSIPERGSLPLTAAPIPRLQRAASFSIAIFTIHRFILVIVGCRVSIETRTPPCPPTTRVRSLPHPVPIATYLAASGGQLNRFSSRILPLSSLTFH